MLKNYSIRQITGISLLIGLLLSTASAAAAEDEQRYYDIEIVIFEQISAIKNLPELIDDNQPLELPEHFIQLGVPAATDANGYIPEYYFKLLPSDNYQLTDAAEKISQSERYHILKHIAWRQPGLDKGVAIPVYIQATVQNDDMNNVTGTSADNPPLFTSARLDGLLTVTLSRYLHLESDLRFEIDGLAPPPQQEYFNLPDQAEQPVKQAPTTAVYRFHQKRRMRSKELHYIDHPVIGMLVLMTPVELPESAPSQSNRP
jgi:hypothetical protein